MWLLPVQPAAPAPQMCAPHMPCRSVSCSCPRAPLQHVARGQGPRLTLHHAHPHTFVSHLEAPQHDPVWQPVTSHARFICCACKHSPMACVCVCPAMVGPSPLGKGDVSTWWRVRGCTLSCITRRLAPFARANPLHPGAFACPAVLSLGPLVGPARCGRSGVVEAPCVPSYP